MKKFLIFFSFAIVLSGCGDDDGPDTLGTPVALDATDITNSLFVANWQGVNEATGYDIEVSTVDDFSSIVSEQTEVPTNSTGFDGLAQNTQYYYRLTAHVNGGRRSEYSNSIGVITLPSAPIADAATDVTDNSFTANWQPVDGVQTYLLYVSTSMPPELGGAALPNYNGIEVTGNAFEITGLQFNTAYYYQLKSKVQNRVSSYSNSQNVLTL